MQIHWVLFSSEKLSVSVLYELSKSYTVLRIINWMIVISTTLEVEWNVDYLLFT